MGQPFVMYVPPGTQFFNPAILPYAPDYEPPGPLYSVESLFSGVRRLWVQALTGPEETVFIPQGSDWFPKRVIEISVLGEPMLVDGKVGVTNEWTLLGTVTVDRFGTFGYGISD